jgi:hypothetical protein
MNTIDKIVTDDDVAAFAKLGELRYRVIEFTPTPSTCSAFDNLPLDPYCGQGRGSLSQGRHRFRRYDDFKVSFKQGRWNCELLPHRPFIQSPRFNKAVGGVERHLPPLEIDPSEEVNSLFAGFGFDTTIEYHAKIHQVRVITSSDIHGVAVVEGPHRDGHEWQITAVFHRHNVVGGESQLLPNGGGTPFFAHVLLPGQAMCNEDAQMWHNATDIAPLRPEQQGHRDLWIIATNRWTRRRYGDHFDAASTQEGLAQWSKDRPAESPAVLPAS